MFKIDSHIPIPPRREARPLCRKDDPLTAERARELLDYNPETGELRWKTGRNAGKMAGCERSGGYRIVIIDGTTYMAHRLAWLIVHGLWPNEVIDHINRVRDDNRLCNLRECTAAENAQNRKMRGRRDSGLPGVTRKYGKWAAEIWVNGWPRIIGLFEDKHEAHRAFLAEKARINPLFNQDAEVFA